MIQTIFPQSNPSLLIWVDLEMTGLNPDSDKIIELALVLTDSDLNVIAKGPVLAIHQTEETLSRMDEWNQTHHGKSGLIDRVRESTLNEQAVEEQALAFLNQYLKPGESPMCGNSISQDKRFLFRHMPKLEAFFHYRLIDVSTVKELARRWAPDVLAQVKKQESHRALDDILESINELRHYRQHFFKDI